MGSLGIGLFLWGCSSAQPSPAETPSGKGTVAVASDTEAEPPAPAAVAAPAGLFGVGRVNSPAQLSALVSEWINVPVPLEAVIQKEVPALQKVVRFDAPVDFAVTLDPDALSEPKALFAVSIPLSDFRAALDELRSHGHPLERIAPGMQLVTLGEPCLVARANGPASARLICADTRKDLDVLAPYMAASLPTEDLGQDELFLELRATPVRDRFGKKAGWLKVGIPVFLRELATGNPRLDAAVAETTRAVVDEVLAVIPDLDRLVVRAKATRGGEALDVHLGLLMAGDRSWLSQTLAMRAQDAAPAPAMFWQLPAGVDRATYTVQNSHPERIGPLLRGLADLMAGAAEHLEIESKPFEAFRKALLEVNQSTGEFVLAEGPPAEASTRHGAEPWLGLIGDGYTIAGSSDAGGQTANLSAALVEFLNDGTWRKQLAEQMDEELIAKLPPIKKSKAPARYGLPGNTQLFQWKVPPALLERFEPKGSQQTPTKNAAPAAITLAVFLATVDGKTWIAASVDEGLAAEKLAAVLSGTGPTLADDAALATLRNEKAVAGGFTTLSNFFGFLAPYASMAGSQRMSREQFVLAMPHGGKTPILTTLRIDPAGPATWYSFSLPRAAMEDLAAGTVAAAANMGNAF